jgi:signal transduction histidine kinase
MLTRVLAHEIMNSMTPIISLASSASTILKTHSDEVLPTEDFQDVLEAVNTIARRADGLTAFVDSYRSLTRIPRPVFAEVSVQEVLMDAERLMREKMEQAGVNFVVEKPDAEWHFVIDSGLIGQVLTNLLLNAIDAISEQPSPKILVRSGFDNQNRLVIQVEDNGKGILKDIQDDIFIPFFTTKRTGSGIGLSLARQIMSLHGGSIQVESEPGIRTQFNLRF